MVVVRGEDPVPSGFVKVPHTLHPGSPVDLFVCVQYWQLEGTPAPLSEIKVADTTDAGFAGALAQHTATMIFFCYWVFVWCK